MIKNKKKMIPIEDNRYHFFQKSQTMGPSENPTVIITYHLRNKLPLPTQTTELADLHSNAKQQ